MTDSQRQPLSFYSSYQVNGVKHEHSVTSTKILITVFCELPLGYGDREHRKLAAAVVCLQGAGRD